MVFLSSNTVFLPDSSPSWTSSELDVSQSTPFCTVMMHHPFPAVAEMSVVSPSSTEMFFIHMEVNSPLTSVSSLQPSGSPTSTVSLFEPILGMSFQMTVSFPVVTKSVSVSDISDTSVEPHSVVFPFQQPF